MSVDTDVGRGRGLARLLPDSQDHEKWKASTLFAILKELNGHEELSGERRPSDAQDGPKNCEDKRDAEQSFEGIEPDFLVIGKRNRANTVNSLTSIGLKALAKVISQLPHDSSI